jgi:hypothetical protein
VNCSQIKEHSSAAFQNLNDVVRSEDKSNSDAASLLIFFLLSDLLYRLVSIHFNTHQSKENHLRVAKS